MGRYIYYRIGGHFSILYLLTVPLIDLDKLLQEHSKTNSDVKLVADLQMRFATIWNVGFQLLYASTALILDLSNLMKKENLIPDALKRYRYIFFAGIVFPVVCGVQMFWVVYFYDRELVFKKTTEVVISPKVNFIVHTAVLMYAFWELIFLPRDSIKKNNASWIHLHVFNAAYVLITFYTRYVDIGVWPYIVLTATTGTLMFPVILFSLWALSTLGYHLQWHIRDLIWGSRHSKLRSNKRSN